MPPMPQALAYLWNEFVRLASRRGENGFGPLRLTWLEIDAYQRVFSIRFQRWEIEIIERLDDAWILGQAKNES